LLQCVAVCCSVLKCVAVCCSVLQCVPVCCSMLQCVAVCCSVLQCVAVCCSVLQCVAVCRSVRARTLLIRQIFVNIFKSQIPNDFFSLTWVASWLLRTSVRLGEKKILYSFAISTEPSQYTAKHCNILQQSDWPHLVNIHKRQLDRIFARSTQ